MPRRTIPPAHSFLRRATNRLHRRIEQTSVLATLTVPGITLEIYRIAMESLRRAYEEIDYLLIRKGDLCPIGLQVYTPRVPSIDRDLMAFARIPGDTPRPHQRCQLKVPTNEAAYLGMRYVVEGAQLGGRVVYSHLHTAFGDRLHEFGSFWMPDSILQGCWPGVLKSLATVESRRSVADAARAARLTFQHMGLHLALNETAQL